jgi:hypothetical protein
MESLYNTSEHERLAADNESDAIIFQQFFVDYQPVLSEVERYLDETIEKTDYIYREAYIPWKKALHQLLEGVYYLAKKIPLPSKEEFMEALFMFSFKGAVMFLRDICNICQLKLSTEWDKEFQEKINQLLASFSAMEDTRVA